MRSLGWVLVAVACRSPGAGTAEAGLVDVGAPLPAAEAVVDVDFRHRQLVVEIRDESGRTVLSKPVMHLEALEHPFADGPRCVSAVVAAGVTIDCIHDDGRITEEQFTIRDGAFYIDGERAETQPPALVRSLRTSIEQGTRRELEDRRVVDAPEPRCAGITPTHVVSASLVTTRVASDAATPQWSIELSIPAIRARVPFMTLLQGNACWLHVEERAIRFGCQTGEAPIGNEARIVGHTLYLREDRTAIQLPCDVSLHFESRNPCKEYPAMGECH